jgi:hypothetical protein
MLSSEISLAGKRLHSREKPVLSLPKGDSPACSVNALPGVAA